MVLSSKKSTIGARKTGWKEKVHVAENWIEYW